MGSARGQGGRFLTIIAQKVRRTRRTSVPRSALSGNIAAVHATTTDFHPAVLGKPYRPLVVDLFAGVGGLGLGFEQAGSDVVAAVEFDANHCAVHRVNFPLTEVLQRDISKLGGEAIRAAACRGSVAHNRPGPWDGTIDILIGGPPCQGFSAGGRHAHRDPRNTLLTSFARLLRELRPRYFVVENVPGLISKKHRHTYLRFKSKIREAGYTILEPVCVIDAADFGVPQTRRRVIMIGWLPEETPVKYPTPVVRRAGSPPLPGELPAGPSVNDAIGDLPEPGPLNTLTIPQSIGLDGSATVWAGVTSTYVANLNEGVGENLSYPRAMTLNQLSGMSATIHSAAALKRFANTPPGKAERISRFRRLESAGICNTLRAGTGPDHGSHTPPRPLHPAAPRVISVREAARLHSFPDWFRFHETKWHAWREIGNSVPPLLGRAIAKQVVEGATARGTDEG